MGMLETYLRKNAADEAWRTTPLPDISKFPLDQQARAAAEYLIGASGAERDTNRAQAFKNMLAHNPAAVWKRWYNTSKDPNGTAEMWNRVNKSRPASLYDFKPALADYEKRYPGITNWVAGTYGAESSYGANKNAKGNFFQMTPVALRELARRNKLGQLFTQSVSAAPAAKPTGGV